MVLTPLDIHNKEFGNKMRGYNPDQVNDFLDQVIKDYESVLNENDALKAELKS
ncbi:DivIVA domain-containing protein, partial [Staphylococcus epidermidis]